MVFSDKWLPSGAREKLDKWLWDQVDLYEAQQAEAKKKAAPKKTGR